LQNTIHYGSIKKTDIKERWHAKTQKITYFS
jgi:hypothetical protein